MCDRKQRQLSKYSVENIIPLSYTKDKDTGYDEVKGIQSHSWIKVSLHYSLTCSAY